MADFTEAQLGKPVVDDHGTTVGEVSDVRDGMLWVTTVTHADPAVLDELNWNGRGERSTHRLPAGFVDAVGEEAIQLRV
jgi:sporulation protein YlmC with PRC-barrel domain